MFFLDISSWETDLHDPISHGKASFKVENVFSSKSHLDQDINEEHFILKCDIFIFRTRDNESNLLIQVKELQVELERQRVELEKADNLPDKTSNSEVINLRRDILKSVNAKDEILDREYQLNYKFET